MNDYLDVLDKFKDAKEIFDLCDDVQKLREYYRTGTVPKDAGTYKIVDDKIFF